MDKLKTYGDIYDEEFLKKFGEYREDVEKAELEKKFEVDVKKIADLCDIEVSYKDLDVVEDQDEMGDCKMMHSVAKTNLKDYDTDIDNRKVTINKSRSKQVKRFNLAHEIGHILLGNLSMSIENSEDNFLKSILKRMDEINCNIFATELLMPEILVRDVLEEVMTDLEYNSNQKFSDSDIDFLSQKAANLMNVSTNLFKERIKNLNIFN